MRSNTLSLTLASLALLLSFQEHCRIQAQSVEAGPSSQTATGQQREAYPASSRLGRRSAAGQEAFQPQRRRVSKATLRRRQEIMDDESGPAVVVRPVRQSSTNAAPTGSRSSTSDREDQNVDLSRAVDNAAATPSLDAISKSVPLVSNGPRPGEPSSASVSIPVSETSSSEARSTSSSASSTSSSSSSSAASSTSSSESRESSSSRPTSTSSSSSVSSQSPSVVMSTTTLSSSSEAASPTNSSAPITSVWQAYNKNSKYFPVAVGVTIVVGIAILVALVAILQCIARAPRFRKDQDRPLLIPRDSTWSGSDASGSIGGLASDTASRRDSINSQVAGARRGSWEKFGTSPSRVDSIISSGSKRGSIIVDERDITANSSATWAKEDFLPHSGEMDAAPVNNSFSIVDVYPTLPKFARGAITPTLGSAPGNGAGASNLGSPYPPFPPGRSSLSSTNSTPQFQQTTLPVIRKMDSAIYPNHYSNASQTQPPMTQRLARGPSILFKPRPGPTEQQSGHRLSMNRGGLPSHVVLPPGVAERRRWERCST